MAVGLQAPEKLLPVEGIRLAAVEAGIRKAGRLDLALVEMAEGTRVSAVFTRNAFCAAPVTLARRHLNAEPSRYLLINAGNANAGTGRQGMADAEQSCEWVAEATGATPGSVLPFSTGVIGERLNMPAFEKAIPEAAQGLEADGWLAAARAMMTTDTLPKGVSRQVEIDGKTVTITGIAKGSGMIRPDMATMLGFVATDAAIDPHVLYPCLREATDASFNSITVDGDTSTNDACVLMATGRAGNAEITTGTDELRRFQAALTEVMQALAQAIIRDGEGATKFITLRVRGGASHEECRQVAFTVAHSPLVKTAFFASDPNWGRILAAVGRSGLDDLDLTGVDICLDDVRIVRAGEPDPDYTEARGQAVMDREEITVDIQLGRGGFESTVWTTDLSHDYVRINAEYRT